MYFGGKNDGSERLLGGALVGRDALVEHERAGAGQRVGVDDGEVDRRGRVERLERRGWVRFWEGTARRVREGLLVEEVDAAERARGTCGDWVSGGGSERVVRRTTASVLAELEDVCFSKSARA